MITFVNFAPIEFMGGAENWIYETSKLISRYKKVSLVIVSPKIGNIYAKRILKRNFDKRVKIELRDEGIDNNELTIKSFIPFTKEYFKIRSIFRESELIYFKYEILEMMICFYFGGIFIYKKLIAGLHTALIYTSPRSLIEKLHNGIYLSFMSKFILRKVYKVHLISPKDNLFLEKEFRLKNILFIPNGVNISNFQMNNKHRSNILQILFVGELTERKGIDVLVNLIKNSHGRYHFHVAGNGPLRKNIMDICKNFSNTTYYGYLQKQELYKLYKKVDLLLLPSRAEGFPLVMHEAMSLGLPIVNSEDIQLNLPKYVEYSASNREQNEYLSLFEYLSGMKRTEKYVMLRHKIKKYYDKNLSLSINQQKLLNELFEINI